MQYIREFFSTTFRYIIDYHTRTNREFGNLKNDLLVILKTVTNEFLIKKCAQ